MMKMKTTVKKGLAAAAVAMIIGVSTPTYAHVMSAGKEYTVGYYASQKYEKKYPSAEVKALIDLQDYLIESNTDKLNYSYTEVPEKKERKRWLQKVKLSSDKSLNAFCFPGGILYVTQGLHDYLVEYRPEDGRFPKSYRGTDNFAYENMMSAVLAHEMAHFANEDFLDSYDKQFYSNLLINIFGAKYGNSELHQMAANIFDIMLTRQMSFSSEQKADEDAMKYMLKASKIFDYPYVKTSDQLSIGGMAMLQHEMLRYEATHGTVSNYIQPHSKTEVRLQRACDFIKETSKGRVIINPNGHFTVDGVDYTDAFKDDIRYSATEQRFATAGAIAEAIYYGVYDDIKNDVDLYNRIEFYESNDGVSIYLRTSDNGLIWVMNTNPTFVNAWRNLKIDKWDQDSKDFYNTKMHLLFEPARKKLTQIMIYA